MKTRITIITISAILLGFALGFFVSGRMTHGRMEHIVKMQQPEGMKKRMMRIIQPTKDQVEKIEGILDEHTNTVDVLRKKNRAQLRSAHQELRDALHEVLTEEQELRLQKAHRKMFRSHRPPPPHHLE